MYRCTKYFTDPYLINNQGDQVEVKQGEEVDIVIEEERGPNPEDDEIPHFMLILGDEKHEISRIDIDTHFEYLNS